MPVLTDFSEDLVEKWTGGPKRGKFWMYEMCIIYKNSAFINISGFFLGLFLAWGEEKFIFVKY